MSPSKDTCDEYRNKRDFRRTDEPTGESPSESVGEQVHCTRFVIQKHDASTLHYDFRIEVDGVLKSWAVPKGPSTDPREKQLAVSTEDHPLDYARFEGVIPEDQYGAGAVLVWDHGTYRNITRHDDDDEEPVPLVQAIDDGHLAVWLEGEKLQGGYALTRLDRGDGKQWLLVKMDDEEADARRNPTSTQAKSVVSGRTIEEITDDAQDQR